MMAYPYPPISFWRWLVLLGSILGSLVFLALIALLVYLLFRTLRPRRSRPVAEFPEIHDGSPVRYRAPDGSLWLFEGVKVEAQGYGSNYWIRIGRVTQL